MSIKSNYFIMNKIYVYEHLLDGKVFYVGKGVGTRAEDIKHRTLEWNAVVDDRYNDIEFRILEHFDTISESDKYEKRHVDKVISENRNAEIIINTLPKYYIGDYLEVSEANFSVLRSYIGSYLDKDAKLNLCIELNIKGENNVVKRWRAIKSILKKSGYEIKDTRKVIKDKRTHVSMITGHPRLIMEYYINKYHKNS